MYSYGNCSIYFIGNNQLIFIIMAGELANSPNVRIITTKATKLQRKLVLCLCAHGISFRSIFFLLPPLHHIQRQFIDIDYTDNIVFYHLFFSCWHFSHLATPLHTFLALSKWEQTAAREWGGNEKWHEKERWWWVTNLCLYKSCIRTLLAKGSLVQ